MLMLRNRASRTRWTSLALAGGLLASCTNADAPPAAPEPQVSGSRQAVVAGAGYTTFDVNLGGCNDSPNGVNCNNYTSKDKVYMTGGPSAGGLSAGSYYFAVLAPGHQNDGFVEGAVGNLSDAAVPSGAKRCGGASPRSLPARRAGLRGSRHRSVRSGYFCPWNPFGDR